ncbi:MAG: hypothetical protein IJJ60_05680, partial [Clostridia bacterium]|nr:hypothetical protein [Clostridia bacterium]
RRVPLQVHHHWISFSGGNHSLGAKEWFPPFRDLNSRNSPSWGDCSFSVDLTADLFSATGGNRRFVPFRENHKGKAHLSAYSKNGWKERSPIRFCMQ